MKAQTSTRSRDRARLEVTLPDQLAEFLARVVRTSRHFQPKLDVRRVAVRIPGLPAALDGFTIAQISDLHIGIGSWMPMHVDQAAQSIRQERPDVVVNTGDFLQGEPPLDVVATLARRLLIEAKLHTRGPVNLAITGNHDYFQGEDFEETLVEHITRQGIDVLQNRIARVERGGGTITFAGMSSREPGFDDVLHDLENSPSPRIVLVHEPDVAERLPQNSAELVLAGHTHGGQIVIPGLRPLILKYFNGSKYDAGPYRINGNPTYVNRGLGCTGLPIRFRAPPELTYFRLVYCPPGDPKSILVR